jgi:hypothetical protein
VWFLPEIQEREINKGIHMTLSDPGTATGSNGWSYPPAKYPMTMSDPFTLIRCFQSGYFPFKIENALEGNRLAKSMIWLLLWLR